MSTAAERRRRWRLILGGENADGVGAVLGADDLRMDQALQWLYGGDGEPGTGRRGGMEASSPKVARWLGDIRTYFPSSVVRVMQQDAIERLNLKQLLFEPEVLSTIEPDVRLVSTLLSLRALLPARARETARLVVSKVVEEVNRRLASRLRQAVTGSLNRAMRNRRPRHAEIDWHRTIRANLRHYQPEYKTVIPETRIGFGRKRTSLRDIVLCVDQSGSMATSVVYSGILAAVMATIASVRTRLVVFDTAVVDLTEQLSDPVEVLFGTQLGGGTDINRALGYCQTLIDRPAETILILISDLYEGGNKEEMIKRCAQLCQQGVQMIALLALSDDGAPAFDHGVAGLLTGLGIPSFACTPDQFPDLIAAAIERTDMFAWTARQGLVTAR
jgi:Mg-chelatase subunit ChlD